MAPSSVGTVEGVVQSSQWSEVRWGGAGFREILRTMAEGSIHHGDNQGTAKDETNIQTTTLVRTCECLHGKTEQLSRYSQCYRKAGRRAFVVVGEKQDIKHTALSIKCRRAKSPASQQNIWACPTHHSTPSQHLYSTSPHHRRRAARPSRKQKRIKKINYTMYAKRTLS